MGYAQALLSRDVGREQRKLESQASKKGLFGSVGRSLGGLLAMGLTGGAASPLVAGLMAGGGSLIGGAIGSNQAKIKEGMFFKGERKDLKSKLGGLGSENVMGAITSGITAGTTQALSQTKAMQEAKQLYQTKTLAEKGTTSAAGFKAAAESAKFKGLDFAGSRFGAPLTAGGQAGLQVGQQLLSGTANIASTGYGMGRDYLSQGLEKYGQSKILPGAPAASYLSEYLRED